MAFGAAGSANGATVYVSSTGVDTAAGTATAPVKTLSRAIALGGTDIFMAGGAYPLTAPVTIPSGVKVHGDGAPEAAADGGWGTDYVDPTVIVAGSDVGPSAIVLGPGASLERLTLVGGFNTVEAQPGSKLFECELRGGINNAILIRGGTGSGSVTVDRCTILKGGGGVRVENTATATITHTLARGTSGRGFTIAGTGTVVLSNCVAQGSLNDGAAVIGNSNAVIQSCYFRRNAGAGLVVANASPAVRSSVFELNEIGIRLTDSSTGIIDQCTVANNRASGVVLNGGKPSLSRNILANNVRYGYEETARNDGGSIASNLFFGNVLGLHLDDGTTKSLTLAELEANVTNDPRPFGNSSGDPLFQDATASNYRLKTGSPAIDAASNAGSPDIDADGNARLVDINAVGGTGATIADIGAYEAQDHFTTKFGTESYDLRYEADPLRPGVTNEVRYNGLWGFNEFSPLERGEGDILPGRLRMWSYQTGTFATMYHAVKDLIQKSDKIALVTMTVRSIGDNDMPNTLIRANGPEANVTAKYVVVGRGGDAGPTRAGNEFQFPYDFRQGGQRPLPFAINPEYPTDFVWDMLEFYQPLHFNPVDLTSLDVKYVDRATFDARFTTTAAQFTFSSGTEGWDSFSIPLIYNVPSFQYNGGQDSLEIIQNTPVSYGGWFSPAINVAPGKFYRIEAKVKTNEPENRVPWFRLRATDDGFKLSNELYLSPTVGSLTHPTATGETYVMYGRIPPSVSGNVPLRVWFELFGFFPPERTGSLLLTEIKLTTD